jgi:hypothetical protein
VIPGQTTRLELGRTGRPVIGRLAIPETVKAQLENHPWGSIAYSPQPPKPLEVLTVEERRRWTQEERMTFRSHGLAIQSDGSFRAEDVPPGRHLVQVVLYSADRREQGLASLVLGRAQHEIVIPEIAGRHGYTPEPFDVGQVPIKPDHHLQVGDVATDFQAKTLDGKPTRLSDFRGKYLLIAFWSKPFRSDFSLAESRSLRALHKTFGKLNRFAMLGITYDMEVVRLRRLVAQRGWDWLNASVSGDVWDKLLDEYALPRYGSVWLLDPDGKVLARDLRGDAIKQAGTFVARAK